MRIKNNITKTLRKSLFDTPNPINYNKEFKELSNFIFPDKEVFISFLEEENFEQQTFYAEKILLRLCYDSFFAPPSKLLFNTLSMESDIFGEKKRGHIGRDHFVHLVHLYLLGTYSFFYQNILNENIVVFFRNLRSASEIRSSHLSHSVVKDFIVAWRYFVLFHDISYSIEYFLGNENVDVEKKEKYLKVYNNTPLLIGNDLALRCLSRFIGVSKLIKNKTEFCFENIVNQYLSDEVKLKLVKIDLKKYYQLEKIYGFETIRTVYSIFGKENIIPVLYDKQNMQPLLVYKFIDKENFEIHESQTFKRNITITKILDSKDAPYNKDCMSSKSHVWMYFINSEFTIEALVLGFLKNISVETFEKTIEYVHNLTSSQYSMVVSDSSFKEYCFNIYFVLYKFAGLLNTEDTSTQLNSSKYLSEIINNIGQELPVKISEVIKKLLSEKLESVNFEDDMSRKKSLNIILYDYFKLISPTYKGFASEIATPLNSSIKLQFDSKKNLNDIWELLSKKFVTEEIRNKLVIDCIDNSITKTELISDSNKNLDKIKKYLISKTRKTNIVDFEKLLEYKPKFKGVRDNYFDHGVNSSLVFLSVIDIYKQLLSKEEETFKMLLKVALGIDPERDDKYLDHKINIIFSETCFAILTHNIYPEFLGNSHKSYRTKLEKSPFSYFCILMDSLQQWDRKFQVNQAYNDLPYNTVSKGFNIEVRNNKIRISEYNSRMDIRKSLINLKIGIDDYLEKASDLIELNLAEF